ncbi:hypothetical protein DM02DRAFT_206771 [Periconia macrospinosa]|uniref:Uncharacterized protein n=1 Tax=Periconia macrospinosa TaxID=97972 RepID=A0A2V1D7E6_9PLEO|nr:hypothetical protein DM02DRAFT_206771 [Periconia macrospinosa]
MFGSGELMLSTRSGRLAPSFCRPQLGWQVKLQFTRSISNTRTMLHHGLALASRTKVTSPLTVQFRPCERPPSSFQFPPPSILLSASPLSGAYNVAAQILRCSAHLISACRVRTTVSQTGTPLALRIFSTRRGDTNCEFPVDHTLTFPRIAVASSSLTSVLVEITW